MTSTTISHIYILHICYQFIIHRYKDLVPYLTSDLVDILDPPYPQPCTPPLPPKKREGEREKDKRSSVSLQDSQAIFFFVMPLGDVCYFYLIKWNPRDK